MVEQARVGIQVMAAALSLLLGTAFGCSSNAASPSHPAVAATATAAPSPAATTPEPANVEPVEPPDPQVWTTPPDSDVCTAYPSKKATSYQTYPSQQECEDWVRVRRCRPFSSCSDGCNNIGCDRTGMRMTSTLVECGLVVPEIIEFVSKTLRPNKTHDFAVLSEVAKRVLKLPTRQLVITASALPDEVGRSEPAQKQLAKRRAETLRQQFVAQGIDVKRIRIAILEPSKMEMHDYRIGRAWFTFDPPRLEPEEYDSSYPDYDNLCWVKQARSKPAPPP